MNFSGAASQLFLSGDARRFETNGFEKRIAQKRPAIRRDCRPFQICFCVCRGVGDGDDYAHMGFEAFLPLLDRYKPRYLIHGHVHMEYGRDIARVLRRGDTTIINAYERYTLEV